MAGMIAEPPSSDLEEIAEGMIQNPEMRKANPATDISDLPEAKKAQAVTGIKKQPGVFNTAAACG